MPIYSKHLIFFVKKVTIYYSNLIFYLKDRGELSIAVIPLQNLPIARAGSTWIRLRAFKCEASERAGAYMAICL